MTLKQEVIRLFFAISSLMLVVMFTGTNLSIPTSVTAVESQPSTMSSSSIITKTILKTVHRTPRQHGHSQFRKELNITLANKISKSQKIVEISVKKNSLDMEIDTSESLLIPKKSTLGKSEISEKEIKHITAILNQLIRKTDLGARLSTFDSKIN